MVVDVNIGSEVMTGCDLGKKGREVCSPARTLVRSCMLLNEANQVLPPLFEVVSINATRRGACILDLPSLGRNLRN
jgi:hypothetical protein